MEGYNEYAFIDSHTSEACGNSEAIAMELYKQSSRYTDHKAVMYEGIRRTYEEPFKWYFVVGKPFDKAYLKDPEWYMHKGLDTLRKTLGKTSFLVGTKEIIAEKVHVNYLICSDSFCRADGYNTSKYKLHVSQLTDISDRTRVLDYILKEATDRSFEQYKDYIYYIRK